MWAGYQEWPRAAVCVQVSYSLRGVLTWAASYPRFAPGTFYRYIRKIAKKVLVAGPSGFIPALVPLA